MYTTALSEAGHAAIARDLGSWRGAEAVTAYFEEIHRPYGATLHRISNIESESAGPGARARSYVDALLYGGAGELVAQARGVYDDQLTTAGGEWRISARRFTTVERRRVSQP